MDGGDWARSRALMVPRDTCRAANVRMRAQMSKEGGGVPGETGNATRKGCRFATLGEAPWSGLVSAQIAVETPLQLERASATAPSKALSDHSAFKLLIPSIRGQKRRNDIALPRVVEFLAWKVEKKS